MSYTPPETRVYQHLESTDANTQGGDQPAAFVGELHEVFDSKLVEGPGYDALSNAGTQEFTWPGKKSTSIVDLASVRKSIGEVDSQLAANAQAPLSWELRDPSTGKITDIDAIADVEAINQDGFKILESAKNTVARLAASNSIAMSYGQALVKDGGAFAAQVTAGDRIGHGDVHGSIKTVYDDKIFFSGDGHEMTLKADAGSGAVEVTGVVTTERNANIASTVVGQRVMIGSELVTISACTDITGTLEKTLTFLPLKKDHVAGETIIVFDSDGVDKTIAEGDATSAPGYVTVAAGGVDNTEGQGLRMWVENRAVIDGTVDATTDVVSSSSIMMTDADVGKKVVIGDSIGTSGTDGDLDTPNVLETTAETFLDSDIGKFINIDDEIRRVTSVNSSTHKTITYSGTSLSGTGKDFKVFDYNTYTVLAVLSSTDFVTDHDFSSDILGSDPAPVVMLRAVDRFVSEDENNSDTQFKYSGRNISSDTGFVTPMFAELYANDIGLEIYPDYDLLATFRALDITGLTAPRLVHTTDDIEALGTVDDKSALLWAASLGLVALGQGESPSIMLYNINPYAEGQETGYPEDRNESSAYLQALDMLAMHKKPYYLVPLTQNSVVRDAFSSHISSMSDPDEMKERSCLLSYKLPLGDVESSTGYVQPGFNQMSNKSMFDDGTDFASDGQAMAGDKVVITSPEHLAGDYVVGQGSDDDELVLEGADWVVEKEYIDTDATAGSGFVTSNISNKWKDAEIGDYVAIGAESRKITAVTANGGHAYAKLEFIGPDFAVSGAGQEASVIRSSVSVQYHIRPMSKDDQALALKGNAQNRGNRRVVHMWPDVIGIVTCEDTLCGRVVTNYPSYYAAAIIAADLSARRPERSSTGEMVPGVASLDNSNTYFNNSQLNTIAEGGVTILVQETEAEPVTVRHLLTTDMTSTKTQEFAVTRNLDNMSKVTRDTMNPHLNDDQGRVNIDDEAKKLLTIPLQSVLEGFVENKQLVKNGGNMPYVIRGLDTDPNKEDRLVSKVDLNLPIAGNNLDIHFYA